MATDGQKTEGLNRTGLFFEELVHNELLKKDPERVYALKEEQPFDYNTRYYPQSTISGTADFIGFHRSFEGSSLAGHVILGIECKRVNKAKTWVFLKTKTDKHKTIHDDPYYLLRVHYEPGMGGLRTLRKYHETAFNDCFIASKGFELKEDTGNVANIPEEKIYNACKQANLAINGIMLNSDTPGLELFKAKNEPSSVLYYLPIVITNASLQSIELDGQDISIDEGIIEKDKVKYSKLNWLFYSTPLSPDQQINLTINGEDGGTIEVAPERRLVAVVNVNSIREFLDYLPRLVG